MYRLPGLITCFYKTPRLCIQKLFTVLSKLEDALLPKKHTIIEQVGGGVTNQKLSWNRMNNGQLVIGVLHVFMRCISNTYKKTMLHFSDILHTRNEVFTLLLYSVEMSMSQENPSTKMSQIWCANVHEHSDSSLNSTTLWLASDCTNNCVHFLHGLNIHASHPSLNLWLSIDLVCSPHTHIVCLASLLHGLI